MSPGLHAWAYLFGPKPVLALVYSNILNSFVPLNSKIVASLTSTKARLVELSSCTFFIITQLVSSFFKRVVTFKSWYQRRTFTYQWLLVELSREGANFHEILKPNDQMGKLINLAALTTALKLIFTRFLFLSCTISIINQPMPI